MANILLVHGAISDGSSWAEVIPHLEAVGHKVLAVQQPLTSLPEDIAKVQVALATLPAPVVIVGHSFGGVVITNAAHNEPKVAALVYVAAFGPDEGETMIDLRKNFTPLPSNQDLVPDSAGRFTLSQPDFIKYFCPDVDLAKARVMAAVQGPSDRARFAWKSSPPAWKEKPAWCIVSEHDQIIQPELELFCAERMKAKKIVKVPGASHPKVVAETILEAARAVALK